MVGFIVSGWYTRDYAKWVQALLLSLERFGYPHDFVERDVSSGVKLVSGYLPKFD